MMADEVTDMEIDKLTNMMAKIPNEDFSDMTWSIDVTLAIAL